MRRCGNCGSQKLEMRNIKGTVRPWKDYTQVELAQDQEVLVCGACGNQVLKSSDLHKLDENVAESLKAKITEALKYLTEELGLSQEAVADALGVSPQFLSTVKAGRKRLSFTTFNLLMSYRKHPHLIMELTGVRVPVLEGIQENIHTYISFNDDQVLESAIRIARTKFISKMVVGRVYEASRVSTLNEDIVDLYNAGSKEHGRGYDVSSAGFIHYAGLDEHEKRKQ